jgi:4-amino-4-deoxy-L-arabinose transferase-like glycosyltransferase
MADEWQYEILGWNIAAGHGYSLSFDAPYEPTFLREPGYPLFIALLYKVFGRKYLFIYITQILLFCFTCILTYKIYKEIFGINIAKYSAFFVAACLTLANYSVIFYSENFFIFLLCLNIYFAILAKHTGNIKWFIATGVISGLTVLTKSIMIFFPFLIVCFFLLGRNKNFKLTNYTANIILMFFLCAATLTPWVFRNYRLFGMKNLNSRSEIVLLMRALKTEYPIEKIKIAYVYYFSEYLGAKFFPQAIEKPRDFMLADDHLVYRMEEDLLEQGYSRSEVSAIIRKEALQRIKKHPFKYILQTPLEFIKMMSFMHIPLLNETYVINKFKNINYGLVMLASIRGIYKFVGYFMVILTGIGIYIRRREWVQHFIVLAPILYINGICSLLHGYPRFAVPLIPFYFMYSVIGFTVIFKSLTYKSKDD